MTAPPSAVVVWFRRDLRLADHPALLAAADEARALGRPVVPLFVVDDGLMARAGANRRAYLARTLAALDASPRRVAHRASWTTRGRRGRGGR